MTNRVNARFEFSGGVVVAMIPPEALVQGNRVSVPDGPHDATIQFVRWVATVPPISPTAIDALVGLV